MQVSDLFQLRMQRLAEEVRAAAVQSLIHERQNAEVPADPCPMLSRGGVPDLSERFPPVPSAPQPYAQYGGGGAQPVIVYPLVCHIILLCVLAVYSTVAHFFDCSLPTRL